ncbi:MAG: hypothetical protein IJ013_03505 [Bacteroidaceae bacterium]|nr:hypothetical protein [Bacteroidaceae bacterium]
MVEKTLKVVCGQDSDSIKKLEALCREKAEELKNKIEISNGNTVDVSFWTKGMPELICVGHFHQNKLGEITFVLDFSESTL